MLAEIIWNEGTIAVVMIFSIPIVTIVSVAWRKAEQTRSECELKRSMVERGMSAADIERIITIKSSKD